MGCEVAAPEGLARQGGRPTTTLGDGVTGPLVIKNRPYPTDHRTRTRPSLPDRDHFTDTGRTTREEWKVTVDLLFLKQKLIKMVIPVPGVGPPGLRRKEKRKEKKDSVLE